MEFDLSADIIDIRELIKRFEELETDLQSAHEEGQFMSDFSDWIDNCRDNSNPVYSAFGDERGKEVQEGIEEFYKLREILNSLASYSGNEQWRGDWYPLMLIRDSHFEDYAQELAEDIGSIQKNPQWPYTCIDWAQAAKELQQYYSSIDIEGETYHYR
jgi:hypothetical protein